MSNKTSSGSSENAITMIPIKRSLLTKSCALHLPPVPLEYYQPIGAVVVFWGTLETAIDGILKALLSHTNYERPGWEFLGFKSRKKLLRERIKAAFGSPSTISDAMLPLISSAAEMHWKRNLFVHGHYVHTFPKSGMGHLEVTGKVGRKIITRKFTLEEIQRLYQDLSVLIGELTSLFDPNAPHSPLPSKDRQTLQEITRRHLRDANLPTRALLNLSSQA